MATSDANSEPTMTPAMAASKKAIAPLMTMYSPERSGMAARSSRRSNAPVVSMRPKIPEMRTVSAESSPCSGDSLTTSTGTFAVPIVSSRISARVRCFLRTRTMTATTIRASPAPTRTAAASAAACGLSCAEASIVGPYRPSRRRASIS